MRKKIPKDREGKPLKSFFLIEVELNGVGPPRLTQATIEVIGEKRSTIKTLKGDYYVVENSKIRGLYSV